MALPLPPGKASSSHPDLMSEVIKVSQGISTGAMAESLTQPWGNMGGWVN